MQYQTRQNGFGFIMTDHPVLKTGGIIGYGPFSIFGNVVAWEQGIIEVDTIVDATADLGPVNVGAYGAFYALPQNEGMEPRGAAALGTHGSIDAPINPSIMVEWNGQKGVYTELSASHTIEAGELDINLKNQIGLNSGYFLPEGVFQFHDAVQVGFGVDVTPNTGTKTYLEAEVGIMAAVDSESNIAGGVFGEVTFTVGKI